MWDGRYAQNEHHVLARHRELQFIRSLIAEPLPCLPAFSARPGPGQVESDKLGYITALMTGRQERPDVTTESEMYS